MQELNFEIFREEDPSGKMSKENYIIKNFPDHYEILRKYSEENRLSEIPFKERVYLFLNNLFSKPKCNNPNCKNSVKFKKSTIGYLKYCSKSKARIFLSTHIKTWLLVGHQWYKTT